VAELWVVSKARVKCICGQPDTDGYEVVMGGSGSIGCSFSKHAWAEAKHMADLVAEAFNRESIG